MDQLMRRTAVEAATGLPTSTLHAKIPDVLDHQAARNEAFLRAVRAGDSRTAGLLAHAEPLPVDADEDELARWHKRRRLYPAHEPPGAV